eukprot:SAG31_NODE_9123_length_1330_cov_0.831844_2_plen_99_part_00
MSHGCVYRERVKKKGLGGFILVDTFVCVIQTAQSHHYSSRGNAKNAYLGLGISKWPCLPEFSNEDLHRIQIHSHMRRLAVSIGDVMLDCKISGEVFFA